MSDEDKSVSNAVVRDIKKTFGIDVGDLAKDLTKEYVREQIFGKKAPQVPRTKFTRTLDGLTLFLKSLWWVPAAAYFAFMLAIIAARVLANIAGVNT